MTLPHEPAPEMSSFKWKVAYLVAALLLTGLALLFMPYPKGGN